MNKRQIIASLNKVANELDNSGLFNEATELTNVMHKVAQQVQPWSYKPDKPMTAKPGMNPNEVVYKVLRANFGPDYNNMKDLKIKIRDNYQSLSSQIDAAAKEAKVDPQKASLRLKKVMDASPWHSEVNNSPMYGNKGGASVFDSTQVRNDKPAEKSFGQKGFEANAWNWITKNSNNEGAEKTIQKAVAANKAGKMPHETLNQITALLKPRVDKEYARLKALEGTAAGEMGSFNREPKPYAVGD